MGITDLLNELIIICDTCKQSFKLSGNTLFEFTNHYVYTCPLCSSQERLGHEKTETTLGPYAHLYLNKQYQVCEKLDELHSPTEFPKDIEQVSTNGMLILK